MSKKIYVAQSNIHMAGRGVFASVDFKKNAVIEVCPVITMSAADCIHIMESKLQDYVFEYDDGGVLLALGYGSLFNHRAKPNARYEIAESEGEHPGMLELYFIATKAIAKDEEIFINYGKAYAERFEQ